MSGFDWLDHDEYWDEAPPVYTRDVMFRWVRNLSVGRPWRDMAPDDLSGMMRPVVRALLDAQDAPYDDARKRRLAAAANDHGTFRCAQGCSEQELASEFDLLLDAIKGALRATGIGAREAETRLVSMLTEYWLARRSALRAWYRVGMLGNRQAELWVDRMLEELD